MITTAEEQLYGFTNSLGQKTIRKKEKFSFFVSKNGFKKGDFCQFLASKIYGKIWHCFNIFCNFCVSEIFGMSPVRYLDLEDLDLQVQV